MKRQIFIPNEFQLEAQKMIDESVLKNEIAALIVMPTGTGKTYLAAQWFRLQLEKNPKTRLLYVCHNQDILSQANDKEFANCLSEFDIPRGYYNNSEKNVGQITFATVQTLMRNLNKLPSDYFDYIIVDEAHHYRAKGFEKAIKHFSPKFLLGLTATPNRMDGRPLSDLFGRTIYSASISSGIKNGLLSKIKYYYVDNDIDFSEIKHNSHGRYDEKDLNKKLCIKEYDDAIIKEYNETVKGKYNRKKTICFCATVEHVYRMEKLFNDNGIKAAALTGKRISETGKEVTIHSGKRKQIISMFKDGDYDIIFVRDLFNEGMDIPDADCIMMLRPTESSRIFTQQIGRGLRVWNGKDYLLTLDFTGNCYKCNINYEILNDIFEIDIEKYVGNKIRNKNLSEIIIENLGCEVRLSKRKIDVIKNSEDRTITEEKLIENYYNVKNKLGRQPTSEDFIKDKKGISLYWYSDYQYFFGSWNNFLAGINEKLNARRYSATEKELIDNYFAVKKKLGRQPKESDIAKSGISLFNYGEYIKYFGSWFDFISEVGDNLSLCRGRPIPENDLIDNYFNVKKELGRAPICKEMDTYGKFSSGSYVKRFGKWNKFLLEIGERESDDRKRITDEELIRNYWNLKGKCSNLTSGMVSNKNGSEFDKNVYFERFGSWNKFLLKIGERKTGDRKLIAEEELIDNYFNVKKALGRIPTHDEMSIYGRFGKTVYIKRFGKWNNFLLKIEKGIRDCKKITDEELIRNYLDLKDKHHNLTTRMFSKKKGSLFDVSTYRRRFGNWKKFLGSMDKKSIIDEKCKKNITIVQDYTPKNPLSSQIFEKSGTKSRINAKMLSGYRYGGSENKDNIRRNIIDKIKDDDVVLMLESPELGALKEIEKQGKSPKKIIIPNHLEFDDVAEALKGYKTNMNIELINTSVLQYIVDHPEEHLNFLWLDYCGAFSYYARDLEMIFQREIKNMKLILTYNVFDPKKQDDSYYFTNVISYVLKKLCGKNEILLMEDVSQRYKKMMFSVGFDIKNLRNSEIGN